MARTSKSTQTTADRRLQRQSRRIARQQKELEKEIGISDMRKTSTRQISLNDVIELEPLTDTQYELFQSFAEENADGYFLYGSAGTGKSTLAIYHGLLELLDERSPIKKLVIVRSAVSVRDIGHLPGTDEEKAAVYEHPYHGIMHFLTGRKDAYEKLKEMGKVEFCLTSFLRSETISDAFIVADECQLYNWEEAKTVMTRPGKNTKIVLCGDSKQNDLIYKKSDTTGFQELLSVTKKMPEFRHFKFTVDDIVRSGMCKSFLLACESMGL